MKKRYIKTTAIILTFLTLMLPLASCGKKTGGDSGLASGTYEFDKVVYMNPISSTLYIGGTGQKYVIDLDRKVFAIIDEDSGEAVNEYDFASAEPSEVDKKSWADKFIKVKGIKPQSIDNYKTRLEYNVNDMFSLFKMDKEVWLAFKRANKDGLGEFMTVIAIKLSDESTEYTTGVTGYIMDGIEAPEAVLEAAKTFTSSQFDKAQEEFKDYEYSAWRVEALEHSYTYEDFEGVRLEVYRMNYEFRSDAPDKVVLAGGMYIAENNWVCPTYPDCTYLVFKQEGEELKYLIAMMENDTQPGQDTFNSDLKNSLLNDELTD